MPTYVDLPPLESLRRAQEDVSRGIEDAWEALDRHFRWLLVDYLQNRTAGSHELEGAIIEASYWAERENRIPWRYTWTYLLELMTNAETQPSLAVEVEALAPAEGRAAEMLAILVDSSKPLQPSDLSKRMGLSKQQISNLGKKLEAAGLIVRQRTGGRATWMFPTARGLDLAGKLPGLPVPGKVVGEDDSEEMPEETFWSDDLNDVSEEAA